MERLKQLREESKLSQKSLAEKLQSSQSAISFYETGGREPSINTVDYLLGLTHMRKSVIISELNNSEIALLDAYSKITACKRRRLFAYLKGLTDGSEKEKSRHGNVD